MIDLTDKKTLLALLSKYGFRLQKSLGQHFLIDRKVLDTIVAAGEISREDEVIEIGGGAGVLTQELCQRAGKVDTYEIDERFGRILRNEIKPRYKNLNIVEDDFLDVFNGLSHPCKVISNLPYQITTPVVRKFLEAKIMPKRMVLLIQKEMAERLTAPPGSSKRGWVTVLVQMMGKAKIVAKVEPNSFLPSPKVGSAVLLISDIKIPEGINLEKMLSVVKAGFSSKRRQLHNALAGGLGVDEDLVKIRLEKANIDHRRRAETLNNEEWRKLALLFFK